jgi:p-aminobenzoyl-glutamate transporter AbgT
MTSSTKSALAFLLRGISWFLFVIAGLAFWVGGRAMHEFAKMDRVLAEMVGIGLAAVCGVLGAVVKSAGENFTESEEETTPTT